MMTFKQFITEEFVPENKWGYNLLQWGCISLWGSNFYMDYPLGLPKGPGNVAKVSAALKELANHVKNQDEEEILDFGEWAQTGMKYKDGTAALTKDLYDKIMHSAERKTDKPLTLYRHGEIYSTGWTSTTISKLTPGADNHVFELPVGTKVIFADGIADTNEVIIDSAILKNLLSEESVTPRIKPIPEVKDLTSFRSDIDSLSKRLTKLWGSPSITTGGMNRSRIDCQNHRV